MKIWGNIRPNHVLAAACAISLVYKIALRNREDLVTGVSDFFREFTDSTEYNNKENQFLLGNYAPVEEENFNIPLVASQGALPEDVEGLFLRVGPNPLTTERKRKYHWFDGHGMIHSVRVYPPGQTAGEGGSRAVYSNQWVRTPRFEIESEKKRPVFLQLGEYVGWLGLLKILLLTPLHHWAFDTSRLKVGQANTAVLLHDSGLYSLHEGSLPFKIKWKDDNKFESLGYEDFGGGLDFPVSAHARVDPSDGSLYFNGYSVDQSDPMKAGRVDSQGHLTSLYTVPLPVRSWTHDFLFTENFVLLFETSVHFDKTGIVKGQLFGLTHDHKFKVGIQSKSAEDAEETVWITADRPYALIHALNAWEETSKGTVVGQGGPPGDVIVLWAPLAESFSGVLEENDNTVMLSELRIDLQAQKMEITQVAKGPGEFPRVHPDFLGKASKFGFVCGMRWSDGLFDRIEKYDLKEKRLVASAHYPEGVFGGEAVPIPKKRKRHTGEGADEQKGDASDAVYLSTFTHDTKRGVSEWRLYDGETLSEVPVFTAPVPVRVPFGFHGTWIGEGELQRHLKS
uniref:Dioxygenase n=1 Tax=Chromera velia CCMP2878 TaxID=1169474 RepID=A0A0G4IBB4_9ALVE|mmetsp:Transcript_13958/g.27902  ORF Transcript_13958/g.27902 Transcript_13958/m.27902 type:complete len:567 (+) Transcript_13958:158-1858(+)|eukprot:Cvel_12815.t1-p1 / transcript=Cvel_12815.t1 / gene=Cvel_12815 / organism=Chromera_velia_CCMP2878 / gene_product=Carotenoid 9,10(9',10')-cleavage dioxygenase, putative / transcript_product=Carotenoid 9,10(9',10')-cleavage dioxygenase, putative / location=Cvel_scaffold854:24943-32281(+) / protein_length=566 / sequence_SO=supercontig / SO=protein_coding / is_pseudo=false